MYYVHVYICIFQAYFYLTDRWECTITLYYVAYVFINLSYVYLTRL